MPNLVPRPFVALCLSLAAFRTDMAEAQATKSGWSLYPSAEVSAFYDDNLFLRRRQALGGGGGTVFARYGASLGAIHRGARSAFHGSYGFTGEYFTGVDSVLSEPLARQHVAVGFDTSAGRNGLSVSAAYLLSRRPQEVFDPVEIEFGRRRAEGYSAAAAYNRRLSATHSWGAQYTFGLRELHGIELDPNQQFESTHHALSTSWGHILSRNTSGSLRYSFLMFEGSRRRLNLPGFDEPLVSHVITYGFEHKLGASSDFGVSAGPNYHESFVLDPLGETILGKEWTTTVDGSAAFHTSWQKSDLRIRFSRGQRQFVGASGRTMTDSLVVSLGVRPARKFSFDISPSVQRSVREGQTFKTYRTIVTATLGIMPWCSLHGNYRYSHQDRFFGFAGEEIELTPGGRSRNQAYVGIVIGKTVPLQ